MNEDTRTCLLARVRHKVEANNQTIRMLIIRLVGDIGVEGCKDILLNNNGKPLFNGQELFEDFETYCNTHDITDPEKQIGKKISEDVENRTEIINNLKG